MRRRPARRRGQWPPRRWPAQNRDGCRKSSGSTYELHYLGLRTEMDTRSESDRAPERIRDRSPAGGPSVRNTSSMKATSVRVAVMAPNESRNVNPMPWPLGGRTGPATTSSVPQPALHSVYPRYQRPSAPVASAYRAGRKKRMGAPTWVVAGIGGVTVSRIPWAASPAVLVNPVAIGHD